MAAVQPTGPHGEGQLAELGELALRIGHDMRTIASDELEIGRTALVGRVESIVAEAGIALLGAAVALIGLAMLCVTAVFALQPVIAALWLRMLIMSAVYIGIGGGAVALAARHFIHRDSGEIKHEIAEVESTIGAIEKGLAH